MLRKFLWVLAVLALLTLTGLPVVQAQQNLLQDHSFETPGDYKRIASDPQDNTNFDVPQAWNGWVILPTPGDPEWKNRVPTGFPHTGLFKIDGGRSLHIARGYATFTTAVFQTVAVPDKANVRGSARGFMERGQSGVATPGGQFRIGIDPNGGSNPLDPAIVWSNWATNDDGWVQLSVDATASGTSVTLFLYATQSEPVDPNGIYWDDTSLTVGGAGGTVVTGTPQATAIPVPTPIPFAAFVAPQAPQEDGSIIHTVGEGDTLAAIAVAYGTTTDAILELNNMSSGRFIFPGQRLLIRPAAPGGSSSSDIAEESDEASSTEEVASTEETDVEPLETDEASSATEETQPTTAVEEQPTTVPSTPTEALPAPVTQVAQVNQSDVSGVCLVMFEDANQNRIREDGESLLAAGTITLAMNGETVETYETDGSSEPFCVQDLETGVYTADAQPPSGYGLTTSPQLSVRVQSGQAVNAVFGAAQGVEAIEPPPVDSGNDAPPALVEETTTPETNALLQNLGLIVFGMAGFVLIFGIGAALLLRRR